MLLFSSYSHVQLPPDSLAIHFANERHTVMQDDAIGFGSHTVCKGSEPVTKRFSADKRIPTEAIIVRRFSFPSRGACPRRRANSFRSQGPAAVHAPTPLVFAAALRAMSARLQMKR